MVSVSDIMNAQRLRIIKKKIKNIKYKIGMYRGTSWIERDDGMEIKYRILFYNKNNMGWPR